MDARAREMFENRSYEMDLQFAESRRQERTSERAELQRRLAELEAQGENVDAAAVTAVQTEIEELNGAISRIGRVIDSLRHRLDVPSAMGEFDKFAKELVESATALGAHAAGIVTVARRAEKSAKDLNTFLEALFPEGSTFRSEWERRDGNIFKLIGDAGEESSLEALAALSNVGAFVKSRVATARAALETELTLRR